MLGYGVNSLRYARGFSYFYDSLHAEAALIRRHPDKISGSTIYLYRFNNAEFSPVAGKALCAKPCPLCGHLLRENGVGRVVWFGEDGRPESARGREFPWLTASPAILTRFFLDRSGVDKHGKFIVQKYMAAQ